MHAFYRRLTRTAMAALAGLVFAAAGGSAVADTPAVSFTAAPVGFGSYLTLGWVFNTNASVTVDELGYYDSTGTGLKTSHNLGIFNSTGTLLTSTTVLPGTVDPLVGAFRYAPITPITLAAGQTYTIGGTTDTLGNPLGFDFWGHDVVGLASDPSITLPAAAGVLHSQADNTLVDPTTPGGTDLYAGPNFLIGSGQPLSAVPEPGSLALLLAGGLPLMGCLRRRRMR